MMYTIWFKTDTVGTCGIVCFTACVPRCILRATPSCLVNLDLECPVDDNMYLYRIFVLHGDGNLYLIGHILDCR